MVSTETAVQDFIIFLLTLFVNPEILENTERRYFQAVTVMYIKVYICGIEMSHRIHFWNQISLKMLIFWQNGKKSPPPFFFGKKKFLDRLQK